MTQLRKLRLQENGNMPDHLGEVRRLIDRIALLGKPLDESEKPAILIGTLPDTYDNVRMIDAKDENLTKEAKTKPCLADLVEAEVEAEAEVVDVVVNEVAVDAVVDEAEAEALSMVVEEAIKHLDEDVADMAPVQEPAFIVEKKITTYVSAHTWVDAHQVVLRDPSLLKRKQDGRRNKRDESNAVVRVGGNNWLNVSGVGSVKKEIQTSSGRRIMTLHGVRYVPELQCSLFPVRRQAARSLPADEKVRVHFDDEEFAKVKLQQGSTYAKVDKTNLYCLELESPMDTAMVVNTEEEDRCSCGTLVWVTQDRQRLMLYSDMPTGRCWKLI
ncbi:unnamed protein product [Phytophthora fragariaefolia]|uniref:Unnamed protein product n=1 Tax=Phytophthora fragariaefolia TaxID=1490495 RepID=A0A9W6XBN3_9STRA|nr:unnamed protein product [Phytophthora fragariaefolia]